MKEPDRTRDPDRACEPDSLQAPAIVIQQLRKVVGASFSLGPVSLVIPRGTVCALVGPNGAGKTRKPYGATAVGPVPAAGAADAGSMSASNPTTVGIPVAVCNASRAKSQ